MTEAEWLVCDHPAAMLGLLRSWGASRAAMPSFHVSNHRLALWIDACQKKANTNIGWNAGGVATMTTLWAVGNEWDAQCPLAYRAAILRDIVGNPFRKADTPENAAFVRRHASDECWERYQAAHFVFDADWLTPDVLTLARAADELARPDGTLEDQCLAQLSDAMEETGCDSEAILTHLRTPGLHVRGCHVIDLILGRRKNATDLHWRDRNHDPHRQADCTSQ